MIIKRVKLTNFRSHGEYVLECRRKTTLIVGENGSGKTSVLEAIYEAMQGKSFRAVDREIVKRGEEFYRVELEYTDGERVVVAYEGEGIYGRGADVMGGGEMAVGGVSGARRGKKTFLAGGKKWGRLPKKSRYPVVLFLPDDLHLVGASPGRRRDYFDRVLGELDEGFGRALTRYNKALKQRNEALKMEGVSRDSLFSWNMMLAQYGCEIRQKREGYIGEVNRRLTGMYRTIAENSDEIEVAYAWGGRITNFSDRGTRPKGRTRPLGQGYVAEISNSIPTDTSATWSPRNSNEAPSRPVDESGYLARLEADFERDHLLGHTSYGVHRDNFDFRFNGRVAEGSASRGEVRSMMLALKFIEAEMVTERTGRKPVVLLDDVFSELDETRQRCLVKNFKHNQVIITSVEEV